MLRDVFLCHIALASAEGQASLGRWGQPHLLCCPARKSPGGPQARRGRGRSPGGSQHRHGAEPLGLELAGQLMGQLRRNEANLFHRQAAAASEASQRSGISPSNNQMQKTGAGDLCHSNVYLPLLIWSVRRMRRRLRGQSFRGRGVQAPFHKPGDQLVGFLAKVASYGMEI